MVYLLLALYLLSLFFIFLYSLSQLHLAWHYKKQKRVGNRKFGKITSSNDLPVVTVQIPVYNEIYVVERIIDAVSGLNYPHDKLEIQILDDSTDETTFLIEQKVKIYKEKGINIKHIQREGRAGYKAGALQNGLSKASGEFIAIFDADFVPKPDFLLKMISEFTDSRIGLVQARWGHINENFSLLTKLQAFALNAHFSVEQIGRNQAGSFINFNGTAGVWRKKCIEDAGGWSADTLTEDLDLSYRAQFRGWQFKYIKEIEAPAELPFYMASVKSQQYRWNKGAAETARKHLMHMFRSDGKLVRKVHALFHLLNSSIFICILLAAVLSLPLLILKQSHPDLNQLFVLGNLFFLGFLSISWFYWQGFKAFSSTGSFLTFLKIFPLFLTFSMGLSVHNSIAVIEGFLGRKTPFVRTPKFNQYFHKKDRKTKYIEYKIDLITIFEGLLTLYFFAGILTGFILGDYTFTIFHLMLMTGFSFIFYYSVKPLSNV